MNVRRSSLPSPLEIWTAAIAVSLAIATTTITTAGTMPKLVRRVVMTVVAIAAGAASTEVMRWMVVENVVSARYPTA